MTHDSRMSRALLPLGLLALAVVTGLAVMIVVYKPDRPVATIAPGSSTGPAFVAQMIRPRLGLPLGGILPPGLFGLDADLVFDSSSPGASIGSAGPERFEFRADGWELALVVDAEGRVTSETEIVFVLVFEEQPRRLRCRPGDPVVGTFVITRLAETGELSGHFDVELARCEDADTGEALGWPPEPFVLHGSFDRLAPD